MYFLVACEVSQRVCKAFRDKGHIAFSCDVIEQSGGHPEWHIMQDVLPLLNGFCSFTTGDGVTHELAQRWDMIIAFPPCTYLTTAGAVRLYPTKGVLDEERYKKGLEAAAFFRAIFNANCERIVIENPTPLRVFDLPRYNQVIQPYLFGHPYKKRTCLWLKGVEPTEIITEGVVSYINAGSKNNKGQPRSAQATASKIRDAKTRSKTFEGVAAAMAEQWG